MGRLLLAWASRNRLRTALTVLALQLAVAFVCTLLAAPGQLASFLDDLTTEARLAVTHRSGLAYGLPPSVARRARELSGVEEAMASTYFGGSVEEDGRVSFPSMAVDATRVGRLYPDYDIPPEQLGAFLRRRDAALVGEQTLRRYGWRIGDRIGLASALWGVELDAEVVGSLPSQPGVWLQEAYLEEALRARGHGGLPWNTLLWLRPVPDADREAGRGDPVAQLGVTRAVEALGRELGVPLAVQSERAFFGRLLGDVHGFAALLRAVGLLVGICTAVVAASSVSLQVRDRTRDLVTLRALGWSRARLAALVVGESALLGLAGGVGGVAMAAAWGRLGPYFSRIEGLGAMLAAVRVDAAMIAAVLVSTVLIGAFAGLLPALGVARRGIPQMLREAPG